MLGALWGAVRDGGQFRVGLRVTRAGRASSSHKKYLKTSSESDRYQKSPSLAQQCTLYRSNTIKKLEITDTVRSSESAGFLTLKEVFAVRAVLSAVG